MHLPTTAFILCGIFLVGGVPPASAAAWPQFSLGLGAEYASGDFGTDSTSSYTTIPLVLNWYPSERINMELTVPFINQSTSNTGYAATGGGIPAAQYSGGGWGVNQSGKHVVVTGSEDQSGLGDITLETSYNLLLDGDGLPEFGLIGYLKFPTADADQGLGTGAFDWGAGLHLAKWLGDWQPFVEGRYVFQGASRAQNGARDYFLADAGLGYGWNEDLYFAGFSRVGTASFDGMEAPLEMRLKTAWGFREDTSVEFYLLKGLSGGSPDLGGGLSFFVSF